MGNNQRTRLFNILTVIILIATVCLVGFYCLVALNVLSFFPPPVPATVAALPTSTETPTPGVPTWTPTSTPTELPPTNTPRPTATFTPVPTFPPTHTPTPTDTATPRATQSPWPFTCEVELLRPEYEDWSGVAGHIQDLDGNPLPGYFVKLEGPISVPAVRAGENSRINAIYGSEAAWEQPYNPSAYQAMTIRVQLCRLLTDECQVVSDVITVELGGYASGSLGYVTCTKNWEDWP
jgi:hypothetical protein